MFWQLACADFTFPLLTHEQSLDIVAMLGFEGVDIGLFEGRSHLVPSIEFYQKDRCRRLQESVTQRGLKVADIFLQVDPNFKLFAINHPDRTRRDKARDWFLRALEYARGCDCHHVTALPGVVFDGDAPGDSLSRCYDELAWRVERAGDAAVTFGVEAHVGSIAPSPAAAVELVQAVPGLTLTLDYTHFTRDGLNDEQIEPLIAHASHFHIRGASPGRLQCSFKDNVIDYARVLEKLEQRNYQGYLGIEYVWIDWEHCNEVDNISETILFRDFVRSHFSQPFTAL